jgi:hypothetical protein
LYEDNFYTDAVGILKALKDVDCKNYQSAERHLNFVGCLEEHLQDYLSEELGMDSKNLKSQYKNKKDVIKVISDMLGVDTEGMTPDMAAQAAFGSIKKVSKDTKPVILKMISLAKEVGIKVDTKKLPKELFESSDCIHNEYGYCETLDQLDDKDLDRLAGEIRHEDDILHLYDDDELIVVDQDTGEELTESLQLNEVLSRHERLKAKLRFVRTSAKRQRKAQLALKKRSTSQNLNKKARRAAVNALKSKLLKKPVSDMTVADKERVEKMLQSRKSLIDRLAMKMVPKIRKIESERLSHSKATKES